MCSRFERMDNYFFIWTRGELVLKSVIKCGGRCCLFGFRLICFFFGREPVSSFELFCFHL